MPEIEVEIATWTEPQRHFWANGAKFRLFRAGVGSGKTWAGSIEIVRQPRSVGLVIAPTYPMLRDSTIRTFLDLTRSAGILKQWRKGDHEATLLNGTEVLFRTASDPDRLRGPNLGWFWLDEGALAAPETWPILLGRLRLPPRRGWVTTTPRGRLNWTHTTFHDGGEEYATIVADSRSNVYQPAEFVASMLANYSHDFARQEIGGEVLDDAQEALILPGWLDVIEAAIRDERRHPPGRRKMGVDLGYGTGRDSFTAIARDDLGILAAVESPFVGVGQAAAIVAKLAGRLRIPAHQVVYDANGPGRDMPRYLDAVGFGGCLPYFGNGPGGKLATNLRSLCAWRMRQRLDIDRPGRMTLGPHVDPLKSHPLFIPEPSKPQPTALFSLPADRPWWQRLRQELEGLRYSMRARKVELEKKDEFAARLKRSPDLADALIMSFYDPD